MLRFVTVAALCMGALISSQGNAFARGGSYGGHSSSGGYLSGTGSNSSSHYSSGYTTRNGTSIAPYHATNPNSTRTDNYEARGNYNPYKGTYGNRLVDR
ncbi:hypothetical protein RMHFA_05579 [Roseomonas mucosa]|nr:hypothetical protein RMHFA_05579 [Roseomonas mucosa]